MSKLNEFELPKNTFIGGWFIPNQVCDNLIKYYEKNKNKVVDGFMMNGQKKQLEINKDIKSSKELYIKPDNIDDEIKSYRFYLRECLKNYTKKYTDVDMSNGKFNITKDFNYQHYKPGEGFKTWHCERGSLNTSTRVLVFMTYLNNINDGGTIFKNFDLITPAKKGLTLIWPTDWPWTQKGQISKTKEKHIITGWYNFYE